MTSPSKILTVEDDEDQKFRLSSPSILSGEEDQNRRPSSSPSILTGEEDEKRRPSSPLFPPQEDDDTPPHSHRRRWSTPIESSTTGGGRSLSDHRESRGSSSSSGVNLQEFFSCSSENSYSFYLGDNISQWGPSGIPPLLRKSRSNAPSPSPPRIGRGRRSSLTTTTASKQRRDLPPFLTTLDCNGRPRFHHRRVRSEGRLEIASVAVDLPEFVSVRGSEGLRIGTVRNSQQHEDEDEEDDDNDQEQNH